MTRFPLRPVDGKSYPDGGRSAKMPNVMPAVTCQAVVDRIEILTYNVRGFRFRLIDPKALAFEPGQFMIVHVPKDGGEAME